MVFFNVCISQQWWVAGLLVGAWWGRGLCWWVEVFDCGFVVVGLLGNGGGFGGWCVVG